MRSWVLRQPMIFISYSRKDFHFAEALAATLRRSGQLDVWLDAWDLRPGTDWSAEIDGAISRASAVMVVASADAMTSEYVTSEWARAQQRGIPVHVAIIDQVLLHPDLYQCRQHDLRAQFYRRSSALGRELMGVSGSVATAGRTAWSRRVPRPAAVAVAAMACAAIALCIPAAGCLRGYVLLSDDNVRLARYFLGMSLSYCVFAVTILIAAVRLCDRSAPGSTLSQTVWSVLVFTAVTLPTVITNLEVQQYRIRSHVGTDAVLAAIVVALVAGSVGLMLVMRSPSVHLWLPSGEGYLRVRQQILGLTTTRRQKRRLWRPHFRYQWRDYAVQFAKLNLPAGRSVCSIRFHPADGRIAALLAEACRDAGLSITNDAPQWIFVIVTANTRWDEIATLPLVDRAKVVFLLATSLRLPVDAETFRKNQWIDFREQLPESIFGFLWPLRTGTPVRDSSVPIPIDVARFRAPQMVKGLVVLCQGYFAITAATATAMLLTAPTSGYTWNLALAALGTAWLLGYFLVHTTTRRITSTQFGYLTVATTLAVSLWAFVLTISLTGTLTNKIAEEDARIRVALSATGWAVALSGTLIRQYFNLRTCWLPDMKQSKSRGAVSSGWFAMYLPALAIAIASAILPLLPA